MPVPAGFRFLILLLTFLPPTMLVVAGHPWLALGLLALLHAPFLWGTLFPHSALFGPVMHRLPDTQHGVWLTVDDGPSTDTPGLLDLLDRHGARATFFLVAERARDRPDLVAAIVARGHDIGNHSATHPAAWFWALSPRRIAAEIGDAQAALTNLSGKPPRWFRAVVGHANPFVAPALARHGLVRVSWSARGFDGVSGNVDAVVGRIARDLGNGAIVLLHEGASHRQSVAIAEGVLRQIEARGLRTVIP